MAHIRDLLLQPSSVQSSRQETGSLPSTAHAVHPQLAQRISDENKKRDKLQGPFVAHTAVHLPSISFSEGIVGRCRYLKSALLNVTNIERHADVSKGSLMIFALGIITLSCHRVINNFYRFYDQYMQTSNLCFAIPYAIEWNEDNEETLLQRM